ncbi:MAG: bifunctional aspartate kinase/diaminopimelate decarboxylase [Alphaproteobacteria bacterium]|nr:bifunctional aspartate kinase/diaminopimelate decarboxylase [Alphaproteobacteria bacterium]
MAERPWIVLKFGGTSVTGAARWARVREIVDARLAEGLRPLVVCSAISGISDALEALIAASAAGRDPTDALAEIEARHRTQADALGVSLEDACGDLLDDLRRLARGASLVAEASPRLRARVLSAGELLSTRIGAAWLAEQGVSVRWQDARAMLTSEPARGLPAEVRYLSARCGTQADPALQARLDALDAEVVLTQGFIARNPQGETVLLGRGGSDTSAALFAARVGAARLEILTDVPGMFTTNPRAVPSARLLRRLGYDEAQELASAGAKVLHPRAIAPARAHGIPILVGATDGPDDAFTEIGQPLPGPPRVKAVVARRGVGLVSMDTLGMWQEPGFLADAFAVFKAHGLSVDLVATSESNVTVSLDLAANALPPEVVEPLLADLGALCRARYIGPTGAVSLVGRGIRAILHELGPALERFRDHKVHLVSQAASDLNLTFVVDEPHLATLVDQLHARLFGSSRADELLGPRWDELGEAPPAPQRAGWWVARQEELLEEAARGTPCYAYDPDTLDRNISALLGLRSIDRVLYAIKANHHPEILRRVHARGLGFECVSPAELRFVRGLFGALPPERLLFTPNFAAAEEYAQGFEAGATVTLDSVYPLRHWPELFQDRAVFVRLDPGRGHGHHRYVVTAGKQSKFGVPASDLDELLDLVARHRVRVEGLHAHAGSGVHHLRAWVDKATLLASVAEQLPDVRVLDLGGGLAVPDRADQDPIDLAAIDASLMAFRAVHPRFTLWMEPGRFIIATAGALLARVNQVKGKDGRRFVGVDAGMNSLIRPALYGAWHEILNLSRLDAPPAWTADVVGPICETGDVLGHDRRLPETAEGDVMLIANAGAYGRTMASHYNMRPPGREVMMPPSCR